MNYARLAAGLLLTGLLFVFGIVRAAFAIIGTATAPEDYAAFKERMPEVAQWLFTTPWPVPTVIVVAMAFAAAYLLFTGTKKTAQAAIADGPPTLGVEDVRQLIREELDLNHVITTGEAPKEPPAPPAPKPRLRLSTAEQERVTDRLIKLDDYLAVELPEKLAPIRALLNWQKILQESGGEGLHWAAEAPRGTLRQLIDGIAQSLLPYEADTAILDLRPMAIKTKALPLWDAMLEFTNVTQIMTAETRNPAPLNLAGQNFGRVVGELYNEIERVRRDIADWRKRIAQGDLG